MKNVLMASIKSTSLETNAPFGSFTAVLSAPTVDRDDEVVDAFCFNPLPDHITIDLDHAMSVEKTVASGKPEYDAAGLLQFSGTYASHPLAQMTRSLVDEGHLRTLSVAFHPDPKFSIWERDKLDGKMHLRKSELLNAGFVGVPSNREAIVTASKSLGLDPDSPAVRTLLRQAKSVIGSNEALRDTLQEALRAQYPGAWVYVRAVMPGDTQADGIPEVIFDIEENGSCSTWQCDYAIDSAGVVSFSDTNEAEIGEVVISKAVNTTPDRKAAPSGAPLDPASAALARAKADLILADAALAAS